MLYWMVTAIFTSYHQQRLLREDLQQIKKQNNFWVAEKICNEAFQYLYPRPEYFRAQYRANLYILKNLLFSNQADPKEIIKFYKEARTNKGFGPPLRFKDVGVANMIGWRLKQTRKTKATLTLNNNRINCFILIYYRKIPKIYASCTF